MENFSQVGVLCVWNEKERAVVVLLFVRYVVLLLVLFLLCVVYFLCNFYTVLCCSGVIFTLCNFYIVLCLILCLNEIDTWIIYCIFFNAKSIF